MNRALSTIALIVAVTISSIATSHSRGLIGTDSLALDTATIAVSSVELASDSLARLCAEHAVLSAKSLSYNAGIVNYKREVKHEFEVTNIGSKPLIIFSLRTGTSSMKAKITRKPLDPGQSTRLRVEYEISKMPLGEFMRNIELRSNSAGGAITVFTLSGHSVDMSNSATQSR